VPVEGGVYVRFAVQTTHKIPGDGAAAFADYLTSTSRRGDYYLGGDDGAERPEGRWHGPPATLRGLGVDPEGPVERGALASFMGGVAPATGEPFRRVGGDGSRVAGIDLTFSAPKSVSALWAVASPYRRAQIEAAHRAAVAGARDRIEREVAVVRRRRDGRVESERAAALVAAEFLHTASRLTRDQEADGGVPDPQLHSHLVVLAAERADGQLAAVDSRELFRSARVNGAWYRAELAARLVELGVEVRGGTGRDGRYFEAAGVPEALSTRWSARSEDIARAAREFRQRYGRDPRGAGELGALATRTRGSKAMTSVVEVDGAWRAVGEEYGLSAERVEGLFGDRERFEPRDLATGLLADVCRERSTVSERDLWARVYELSTGTCHPCEVGKVVDGLVRRGELVALEDGSWTTRELRDLERETVERAERRGAEVPAPVRRQSLQQARARAEGRVGGRLTAEQEHALDVVTSGGGVSVLVGQAGTGKGVVISTAREAWEADSQRVIGTAVAGATAKRLAADTGMSETMTTDALLGRVQSGRLGLDDLSVVVMDEAAMADTRRLAALTRATSESGSKLVLVGDQGQLSAIGAGGLFDSLRAKVPAAELTEVQRAREDWERDAWVQVRAGDAAPALAAYRARGRLHVSDTREEAGERMVDDWDRARLDVSEGGCVMICDASNAELDRLNAIAQLRRLSAGELGEERAELPGRPYGLHAGDEVLLTGALYEPGRERVENGTRAHITRAQGRKVALRTEEPEPREVRVDTRRFSELRLAYAQHVYKAQGATVDRALVLTGGWQTDRESAYVALTRARERTDLYVSREDLGEDGMDDDAIQRLSERITVSRSQQASITRAEAPREASITLPESLRPSLVSPPGTQRPPSIVRPEAPRHQDELGVEQEPGSPLQGVRRESLVGRILRERKQLEAQRANERGRGRD